MRNLNNFVGALFIRSLTGVTLPSFQFALRAEALDMLKAWNTGHPGGIATLHANSAPAALLRLEQLIQEAVVTVPRRLIAEAIDLVVFISGRGAQRRIETLARLVGLDPEGEYGLIDLVPAHPSTGTGD